MPAEDQRYDSQRSVALIQQCHSAALICRSNGLQCEPRTQSFNLVGKGGNDGVDGKDGKGGHGGRNGKKGLDNGRITEYAVRNTQWDIGHLQLKYTEEWEKEGFYAWCPKHKQYASIHAIKPPNRSKLAEHGADGKSKKTASHKRQHQLRRQTPVLVRDVLDTFQKQIDKNSFHRTLKFEAIDIGNISRPLEASTRETCQTQYGKLMMAQNVGYSNDRMKINIPSSNKPFVFQQKQSAKLEFRSPGLRLADLALQKVALLCKPSVSNWIVLFEKLIKVLDKSKSTIFPGILHHASQVSISALLRELHTHLKISQLDEDTTIKLYDQMIAVKNIFPNASDKFEDILKVMLKRNRNTLLIKYKFIKMEIFQKNIRDISIRLLYMRANELPMQLNLADLEECVRNRIQFKLTQVLRKIQNISSKQSVNDFMNEIESNLNTFDGECAKTTFIGFIDPDINEVGSDYFQYLRLPENRAPGEDFVFVPQKRENKPEIEVNARDATISTTDVTCDTRSPSTDASSESVHPTTYAKESFTDADESSDTDNYLTCPEDAHSLSDTVSSASTADEYIICRPDTDGSAASSGLDDKVAGDLTSHMSNFNTSQINASEIDDEVISSEDLRASLKGLANSSNEDTESDDCGNDTMESVNLYIKNLSFLNTDGVDLLRKVLQDRYFHEGLQIPKDTFVWLISFFIRHDEVVPEFARICAFHGQSEWLQECILLQIKLIVQSVSLEKEHMLRNQLSAVESQMWLIFLSQRLNNPDEDRSSFSLTTIEEIIKAVRKGELDNHTESDLRNSPLSDWPYKLRLRQEIVVLQMLPVDISSDDKMTEAAYYIWELRNIHGDLFVESLQESLSAKRPDKIDEGILIKLLKNLFCNRWPCDKGTLDIVRKAPCLEWKQTLEGRSGVNKDRKTDELIQMMKGDSNNSIPDGKWGEIKKLLEEISKKEAACSDVIDKEKSSSQQATNMQTRSVGIFEEDDIRKWSVCLQSKRKSNNDAINNMYVPEMLAVIFRGIDLYLRKVFKSSDKPPILRDTQKIAIVLFLLCEEKGTLEQVSTGEGKSLIIVALAIFKLLNGTTVDIITSSSVLAKRDAMEYGELYELFYPNFSHIDNKDKNQIAPVAHNCSEDVEDRKRAYMSLVVYGEIGTFQRDILLDEFYDESIMGDRGSRNVIVDEVDSMLLDKGQNILYLTHEVAGLDSLEQVYVHIWNFVHAKGLFGTQEDEEEVYLCMMSAMYGVVKKDDIQHEFINLAVSQNQVEEIWQNMIDDKLINRHGRILLNEVDINNCKSIRCPDQIPADFHSYVVACIKCALKDTIRKGTTISVPHYLEPFIERHLRTWITNAFKARFLSQYEHYIVDIDRSTNYQEYSKVIIMDTDTGSEQYNCQWNRGLHQFLQLKHGCRISPESLKAVFISNTLFFKRYNANIYGLTGTLGSEAERSLLKRLYNVEYVTVPTFCPSRFIEEEGIVCSTQQEWLEKITICIEDASDSWPVLVICETIKDIHAIENYLKNNSEIVPQLVYDHSYQNTDMLNDEKEVVKGCVILATNLAGRGTDIKISEETSDSGGLFVCLAYMPCNIRVEQQAYGRTARKGQNGSGQMIVLPPKCRDERDETESLSSVARLVTLLTERNMLEQRRISKIQIEYDNKIRVEEETFKKFRDPYVRLRKELQSKGKSSDEIQLILKSILDSWALWLDKVEEQIKNGDDITRQLKQFLTMIDETETDMHKSKPTYKFIESYVNHLKLGKVYIALKKHNMSLKIFDEVIEKESDFAEVAYYYKAHCIVKRDHLNKDGSKRAFLRHMQHAKMLMEKRVEELQDSATIIDTLCKQYLQSQSSFLIEGDYKLQKEGVIGIYQHFLDSIDDACGYEVAPLMLQHIVEDPIQANMIYEDLCRNGILVGHTLAPDYIVKLEDLQEEYQLYMGKIKDTLDQLSGKTEICKDDLKGILPSREEFCSCLLKVDILTQEEEYVTVNMKKIKESPFAALNECLKLAPEKFQYENRPESKDLDDTFVWLYPEHVENMEEKVNILLKAFYAHFGDISAWQALQDQQIIVYNKRAVIKNDVELQLAQLESYDSIDENAFTVIRGIDSAASKHIFQLLHEQRMLSTNSSTGTRFTGTRNFDFKSENYQHYLSEVTSVLLSSFRYRHELKGLLKSCSFTLTPKPQNYLFNELIRRNIVLPRKVSDHLDKDELRKRIGYLYGEERTWTKKIGEFAEEQTIGTFCNGKELYKQNILAMEPLLTKTEIEHVCRLHDVPEHAHDIIVDLMKTTGWLVDDYVAYQQAQQTVRDLMIKAGLFKAESPKYRVKYNGNRRAHQLACEFSCMDLPLKQLVLGKLMTKNHTLRIANSLFLWKSGLSKYKQIDSHFVDLSESLDTDTKRSMAAELAIFSLNGLDHTISLSEERWSRKCIGSLAAIVAFGILQIIAGVLLIIFTAFVLSPVAFGLIGEGVGDILFAIECAFRGYCTALMYAKHKAISLAFSIVLAGIGAWWILRGSRYAKYGIKIGKKALSEVAELAGTETIEQVGTYLGASLISVKKESVNAIVKQVACKVGVQVAEAAAVGVAKEGLNSAIEHLIHHHLKETCSSAIEKAFDNIGRQMDEYGFGDLLETSQLQVDDTTAKVIIAGIISEVLKNDTLFDFQLEHLETLIKSVSSLFAIGIHKLGVNACGTSTCVVVPKMLSSVASTLIFTFSRLKVVDSIANIIRNYVDDVFKQIQAKLKAQVRGDQSTRNGSCSQTEITRNIQVQWKKLIQEKITDKLENTLVKIGANDLATIASRFTNQHIKREYRSTPKHLTPKHELERLQAAYKQHKPVKLSLGNKVEKNNNGTSVISVVHEEYQKTVLELFKKTKDPILFANMIREGIPIQIHCTQAVSEILARPIILRVFDNKVAAEQEFIPKGITDEPTKEPLVFDYHQCKNSSGMSGEYSKSVDTKQLLESSTAMDAKCKRFGCLLQALDEHEMRVNRKEIAKKIKSNSRLYSLIRESFDWNNESSKEERKANNKDKFLAPSQVPTDAAGQPLEEDLETCDKKCRRMVANLLWGDDLTGIDESVFGPHEEVYDHTHIYTFMRLDYRWIPFTNSEIKMGISPSEGKVHNIDEVRKEYFETPSYENQNERQGWKLRRDRTAQEATIHALIRHVELTRVVDDDVPSTVSMCRQTSTGSDVYEQILAHDYVRGLNRERFKILQVAKCLMENAPENDIQRVQTRIEDLEREFLGADGHLVEDPFPELINDRLKSVTSLNELGDILRSAANWKGNLKSGEELEIRPISNTILNYGTGNLRTYCKQKALKLSKQVRSRARKAVPKAVQDKVRNIHLPFVNRKKGGNSQESKPLV